MVNIYEYMNMYVLYACEHKGTHVHFESVKDCRVSFSIILHLTDLKQGVSVNQSLQFWLDWLSSESQSASLHTLVVESVKALSAMTRFLSVYCLYWGFNSSPLTFGARAVCHRGGLFHIEFSECWRVCVSFASYFAVAVTAKAAYRRHRNACHGEDACQVTGVRPEKRAHTFNSKHETERMNCKVGELYSQSPPSVTYFLQQGCTSAPQAVPQLGTKCLFLRPLGVLLT